MKSEQLVNLLSEVTYDLLYDISMGHGEEVLEAPIVDANAKGPEAELALELVKFWDGKKSLSRFNLFANILKICSSEVDILGDIAAITAAAYPVKDEGVKLSSNGIMGLIKNCCSDTSKATAKASEEVAPVENSSPFVPTAEEQPIQEEVEPKHNYMMNNSSEKDMKKVKEHQEMLEAKRALAAERAALK